MSSSGYTSGMKVAVSIPDDVFEEAEALSRLTSQTRSRLYTQALRLYLREQRDREITKQLNELADEIDTSLEPDVAAAAYRTLARSEW